MFLTTKSGRRIEVPGDDEDTEITRQSVEDGTYHSDEELAEFKPFAESDLPESLKKSVIRGRPKANQTKVPIAIRLDNDVLEAFKATGKGWQGRINEALKEWLRDHAA
jgi:uncharacterized protein (DUF4415 family)